MKIFQLPRETSAATRQRTSSNQVPNGDTIGRFRNILIQNRLQEKLFADIVSRLKARGSDVDEGYDRCLHIDCCAFFHQE